MTGFGRGRHAEGAWAVSVELSSVNRKNLDIQVNLPRGWEPLEAKLVSVIRSRLARGRVQVRVGITGSENPNLPHVDLDAAKEIKRDLDAAARQLRLQEVQDIEALLRIPEFWTREESEPDIDAVGTLAETVLSEALTRLIESRRTEGEHLTRVLGEQVTELRGLLAELEKGCAGVKESYREKLLGGLREAGLNEEWTEHPRIVQEIALFAEKTDVREEIDRIRSHLAQAKSKLGDSEPVGRGLDFLAQELGREINTLSVKTQGVELTRLALRFKEVLEQFREQIQNVE